MKKIYIYQNSPRYNRDSKVSRLDIKYIVKENIQKWNIE